MEGTSDENLLHNALRAPAFAVPAHLLPPEKRRALRARGIQVTAQSVVVDPYEVDAVVIRRKPEAKPETYVAKIAMLLGFLGNPATKSFVGRCVIDDLPAPFIAVEGKVTMCDDEPQSTANEDDIIVQALASYQHLLGEFSALTGMEVRFHHGGGDVREPYPDEPGVLHLFSSAGPPGEHGHGYVGIAYGLAITFDNVAPICRLPAKGRGRVLLEKKIPMVQIVGSNVYFLIPTLSYYHRPSSDLIFIKLLVTAWNDLRLHAKQAARRKRASAPEEELVAFGRGRITQAVTDFDKAAREADQKIQQAQKTLADLMRYKHEAEMMAKEFAEAAAITEAVERLPQEFRRIRRHPLVARVDVVDNGIHAETHLITATHAGKAYALGRYVIRIGKEGAVTVWCEETLHPKGVPHPHIRKDGGTCYGNATEAISKHAAYYRYADVIDLVLRWLTTGYTPALALVKIEEWPEHGVIDDLAGTGLVERPATPEEAARFAVAVEAGGIVHVSLSDDESSDSKVVGADTQQGGA